MSLLYVGIRLVKGNIKQIQIDIAVDSATHDMVARCGAGAQPKWTTSVHIRGCRVATI
jgi:hypothetical protein